MSYFVSPEFGRVVLLGGVVAVHMTWRRLVNEVVPLPYLDEVFHVPQAQAYWAGQWSHWDPKITTPPGLYLFSTIFNAIRRVLNPDVEQTTEDLRFVNVFSLYVLLVALYVWSAIARKDVNADNVLQREFNIILFPLLFFFSGLYYTDVFSALTVVLTYVCWSAGEVQGSTKWLWQILHFLVGLISLATRQTNIFWVAVYLAGLQVVETVKREVGARQVHDPAVSEAYFEGWNSTDIYVAFSNNV